MHNVELLSEQIYEGFIVGTGREVCLLENVDLVDVEHKLQEKGQRFCINSWYMILVQNPKETYCWHWNDTSEHLKPVKVGLTDAEVVDIIHNLQERGQYFWTDV